ncbi:MAG: hypothetical protein ABW224_01685 [Kibdelosporangium sp.]
MRVRLRSVIVALFLLAGCGTDAAGPAASVPVPPDEWAAMRNIDSCAILDEAALAKLGKVVAPKFTGASAHNCVVTITAADGAQVVARAYVGERVAADAQQIDLGGTTAFQDASCAVTVKITGDTGISISIEGYEYDKQCAQARDVATAVAPKLKSPPQNQAASPFHGKDPCQPVDQFAKQTGALKQIRRPTIINCELTGATGTLLISHEIENMEGHVHGEPVTIAGKEAMRHQESDTPDRCEVMIMLKPVLTSSYFINRFQVVSGSDPCGKATDAANESAKV